MADINTVILSGRLTRDSELKYGQSGNVTLRFSIANEKTRKNMDGTFSSETYFFDCVIFGKYAEMYSGQLLKGRSVTIQGELKQSRWDQDGQNRTKIEIVCNNVIFQQVVRTPGYNQNDGNNIGKNNYQNNNGYNPNFNNGNNSYNKNYSNSSNGYVNNQNASTLESNGQSSIYNKEDVNALKDNTSFDNLKGPESFQDDDIPF